MKTSILLVISILFISCTPKNKQSQDKDLTITIDSFHIHGTLLTPQKTDKKTLVIIIPGSGPTDRNGNSHLGLNTNTYKQLADSLAKYGISTFRYDKRGVGQSKIQGIRESSIRFDDMVSDAVRIIKHFRQSGDYQKIIVVGHSQGALIGAITADSVVFDGFVSIAGAGRSIDTILYEQLQKNGNFNMKQVRLILKIMRQGLVVPVNDPKLSSIFRTSVQPFLISWMKYSPSKVYSHLKIPTLIIQGVNDIQIPVSDARLLAKNCKTCKLVILTGMNHILKNAPLEQTANKATYSKPDLPLNPDVARIIANFADTLN